MTPFTEAARVLAMSAYHYPSQDNEQGFENAVNLIAKDLTISQMREELGALKAVSKD